MESFMRLLPEHEGVGYQCFRVHPIKTLVGFSANECTRLHIEEVVATLTRDLGGVQDLRLLDIGCGTGDFLRVARSHFASVRGCDLSQEMIEQCSGLDVLRQASAVEIPFSDSSLDVITMINVLHHVAPMHRLPLVEDAVRVLAPGGILLAIEHNPLNPVVRFVVATSAIDRNARLLGRRELTRLLSKAGLACAASTTFVFAPRLARTLLRPCETLLRHLELGAQRIAWGSKRVSSLHGD